MTHALADRYDRSNHRGRTGRSACLLLLCLALGAVGSAQDDSTTAASTTTSTATAVYELSQNQVALGEVGVDVEQLGDGYHSSSYVTLHGLLEMSDDLVTDSTGAAVSYNVTGSVQGIDVNIVATFDDSGVALVIEQAGNKTPFTLASTEPLYVLDNNFLDGFQILATALLDSGMERLEVAAVVPQAAALGRAVISLGGHSSTIVSADKQVEASLLNVSLSVRNQVIEGKVWVDAAGEIVVFEQSIGAVRFERRSAAAITARAASEPVAEASNAAGAAPSGDQVGAGDDASDDDPETAAEFIARTARCVAFTKLSVESTGETLQGVLSLPRAVDSERGAPTLVLLPGSGPVDLRGNSPPLINNAGYEQLANALACRGYGVLRIAKLGIAPSSGDGNAVTLDTYAQNTADWLELLAATPGVDADRLGVIGHSEGGLIALYAAANGVIEPEVLVLLASAGRPFAALLREQLLGSAQRGGADQEALVTLGAQIDEALDAIRRSTGEKLEVTEELTTNPVVALFAHAAGLLRSELDQDPTVLIGDLELPVVIFQGGKDMQVLPVDGRALSRAAPGALLLELPNMSHHLIEVSGAALGGLVPNSDDVISETLVAALATYLNGSLRLAR